MVFDSVNTYIGYLCLAFSAGVGVRLVVDLLAKSVNRASQL